MKSKVFILSGLFVLMGLGAIWLGFSYFRPAAAPDVTFMSIKGEKIPLRALKGHPVLITFWATDCPSCLEEIPHLIELYRDFSERGLKIIAVAMPYDPPNRVLTVSRAKQLPYPVALDVQGRHAQAFYGVRYTPTSFLIALDGTIALQKTGLLDMNALRAQIKAMLLKE